MLQPGLAWSTGLKPRSLDLLIDRGTWFYLHRQGRLEESINHYLEILKPGGRIVFFSSRDFGDGLSDVDEDPLPSAIQNAAKSQKLHVTGQPVHSIRSHPYPLTSRPVYAYLHAFVVTKLRSQK